MKFRNLISLLFLFTFVQIGNAQTIFSEDFESVTAPDLPLDWTTTTEGTDAGFYTGNAEDAIAAGFWIVKEHSTFAMSNDDICVCDKSDDFLILPEQDFSSYTGETIILKFDTWMEDFWGGTSMIKVNTGSGWTDIYTMEPKAEWQTRIVDLSAYAGNSSVLIAFHYNDEGEAGLGLAADNISIYIPENQYDAAIYSVSNTYSDYTEIPNSQLVPIAHSATIYNNGNIVLQNLEITAESSSTGYSETFNISSLAPAEYFTANFELDFTISSIGSTALDYSILHDNTDDNTDNDLNSYNFIITDSIMSKQSGSLDAAVIPQDGETIAQVFNVFQDDTITSVSVNLMMADDSDLIKFYIYEYNDGPTNIIDSTQISFIPINGWETYSFATDTTSGRSLSAGTYAIGIKKTGTGLTALTATDAYYTPNTTYTTHIFITDYFWYSDEQYYGGVNGTHHTYLMRANFGAEQSAVNIATDNNKIHFNIYPNPSNNIVNISSEHTIDLILIYDLQGRLVYEFQNTLNLQIDFSKFGGGLYLCKIKQNGNWSSEKIIIN